MRMTISIYAALFAASILAAECKDGICQLPSGGGEATYTVLSPVPESAVEPIKPASRLKSLDGKTIALVGGSFMANMTHPELKRLILGEYPTAKVYVLSEIGSAGPYPRPGVVRREKDEFQRKLKEFKVDAVVSGNGGCGLCTPKETGSCIAAEVLGIPSVMIAAPGFVKQAKSAAAAAKWRALPRPATLARPTSVRNAGKWQARPTNDRPRLTSARRFCYTVYVFWREPADEA